MLLSGLHPDRTARLDKVEDLAFSGHEHIARQIIKLKRELGSLRRVIMPQRDIIGRLARREFGAIGQDECSDATRRILSQFG